MSKATYNVFICPYIYSCFATNRGVHQIEQGSRHICTVDTPHIDRCGISRNNGAHPTPSSYQQSLPVGFQLHDPSDVMVYSSLLLMLLTRWYQYVFPISKLCSLCLVHVFIFQ